MANFLQAYKKTAKNEGGYTNEPDDNGNWTGGKKGEGVLIGTNYGISAPVLMAYLGRVPTVREMKEMPEERAALIYKINYWDAINGDKIVDQQQAEMIYDSAVNMGCFQAIKLAQRALGIKESGHMDKETLYTLNS